MSKPLKDLERSV